MDIAQNPARHETQSLAELLLIWPSLPDWEPLKARLSAPQHQLTNKDEIATIYKLIQHLRPTMCLEIGSFFGGTSRSMAQALVDADIDGKLITIDPFGGERMPGIIADWPVPLQWLTDFRAVNSMQYFMDHEKEFPGGHDAPLSLVFVDGNHHFDYALFDISRAASMLRPGGVIVVDNMEQDGPRDAVMNFLHRNPAWTFFYGNGVYDAASLARQRIVQHKQEALWGVLLSPEGLQIASQAFRRVQRGGIKYRPLTGIELNIVEARHGGTLRINFLYTLIPYDFHLTGRGLVNKRALIERSIAAETGPMLCPFESVLILEDMRKDVNLWYELEISLYNENEDDAFILLDRQVPYTLEGE